MLADRVVVDSGEVTQADGLTPAQAEWDEVVELTDNTIHNLLHRLKENGWPVPEAGYELAGLDGEIVASAELAWEELKIAFLIEDELACLYQFEQEKWRSYPMQEVLENPEKYISLHIKQEG
jgi:DEAD/DEAH box helicase domain-containing protein